MAIRLCGVFILVAASIHDCGEYRLVSINQLQLLAVSKCYRVIIFKQKQKGIFALTYTISKIPSLCIVILIILHSHINVCVDGVLRFASYYKDHMVLQKSPERAVVWGYGSEGAQVKFTLSGQHQQNISQATVTNGE